MPSEILRHIYKRRISPFSAVLRAWHRANQRQNFCVCKYSMWLSQNADVDAEFESLQTLQKSSPQKVIR
jgi:hypothetical protein